MGWGAAIDDLDAGAVGIHEDSGGFHGFKDDLGAIGPVIVNLS
jgi:hypothetical protein